MDVIRQLMQDAQSVLREMSRTQRLCVMILGITVGLWLCAAAWMGADTGSSSMVPLKYKVPAGDAQDIINKLQDAGIKPVRYEIDSKQIIVPLNLQPDAVLALARDGLMPDGDGEGFSEMIKLWHFGDTSQKSKEMMDFARSNEMARMIESIDIIKEAKVIYSDAAKHSLFGAPMKKHAAVRVRTSLGKKLDEATADTIISLVAASKSGLDPLDVVVSDQGGRKFHARQTNSPSARAQEKFAMEAQLNEDVRRKLEPLFRSMFRNIAYGGEVDVFVYHKVNADYKEEHTTERIEGPKLRAMSKKASTRSESKPAAEPGTRSNTVRATGTLGSSTGITKIDTTDLKESDVNYAPGTKETLLKPTATVVDKSISAVIHLPFKHQKKDGKLIPDVDLEGKVRFDSVTGKPKYKKESVEEIKGDKLESLTRAVAKAAGIEIAEIPEKIEILQIPWAAPVIPETAPGNWAKVVSGIYDHGTEVLALLLALCAMTFVYLQARKATPSEELKLPEEESMELDMIAPMSSADQANAAFETMRDKIADAVAEDPAKAASLVRRWMQKEAF